MTGKLLPVIVGLLFAGFSAEARQSNEQDDAARKKLGDKLLKLSRSLDMKEARYQESGGGGKDFNANDGNSFLSNTTYHSYVWDYCEAWIGGQYCNRWVDPYVSRHGSDGDRSPLEGAVWEEYQKRKGNTGGGGGGNQGQQYKIWQVKTEGGGPLTDVEGKLDKRQLVDWRLLPDVAQKVAKVGEDTAQRNITLTLDQDSVDGSGDAKDTLPNMEALRVMASRWTRMLRNRLVANLGEQRAVDVPIEFALGEDKADCEGYLKAMRTEMDKSRLEPRLDPQPRLDVETRAIQRLEERYELCTKMRKQSVYAVNPKAKGRDIEQEGPQSELIDQEKTRINIALLDFVGMDPNNLPKKNKIQKEDYTQEMTEWGPGAVKPEPVFRTNAEQIESYNKVLAWAAQGFKDVVARAPIIRDNSDETMKHEIKIGTVNAVKLNSLTPEMKEELEGNYPRTGNDGGGGGNPEEYMERTPAELTISRR